MSKSNSSTRSNSVETPVDCDNDIITNTQNSNVPAIMEAAEGQEPILPSSPPPSYEFVLEEVKQLLITFLIFPMKNKLKKV